LLDDGLPELEQGAVLAMLEVRPLSLPLLIGFHRALAERCFRVVPPEGGVRPLLLATHCAHHRSEPNLLPLLALLLHRLGMTVLVHGSLEGAGIAGSAHVFRDLGIMPCATLTHAQQQLERDRLAFVPTALLAPGLASLTARRARLGGGRLAHMLHRMLDPYAGQALAVVATGHGADARLLPSFFQMMEAQALLLEGTEGEPFAHPQRRPAMELVHANGRELLFAQETGMLKPRPAADPLHTADWTRRALRGEVPLPLPLVNQVACCLYGAGYASDINQAKAIAALETGSLVTA
jgi:anthranilate phosphoribosyltransferase